VQAADTSAPTQHSVLQEGRRRAHSAWYAAKHACDRAGSFLAAAAAAAWLWLRQAWNLLGQWGHRALLALQAAWHWVAGRSADAARWLQGLRPGHTAAPA
jgi:hypothetical protein